MNAFESCGYSNFCRACLTSDTMFDNFRQNETYKIVLEHVSRDTGGRYFDCIEDETIKANITKFKINDTVGNPTVYEYTFGAFSPTTLRYVKVLSDIAKRRDLNGKNIIEIGCGYGGQFVVLKQTTPNIKYTFVDLPEVVGLTRKYLTRLNLLDGTKFITSEEDGTYDPHYDFVISNYAFSELTTEQQDFYIDRVISKADHGYITHNQFNGHKLENFVTILKTYKKDVTIIREQPITGDNYIVMW